MRLPAVIAFFFLASCIQVEAHRGTTEFPPLSPDAEVHVVCSEEAPLWVMDEVRVWRTPPEGIEVAEFDVKFPRIRDWDEILEEVRVKARELGGDIVIIGTGTSGLTNRTFQARVRRSYP